MNNVDMDALLMAPFYTQEQLWEEQYRNGHCEHCGYSLLPSEESDEFSKHDDRVGWCNQHEIFIRPWWTPQEADCEEFDFSDWE